MDRVARALTPTNPYAPRVAHLLSMRGAKRNRHWRVAELTNPDGMLKEIVLVAVDRFEAARRFLELAKRQAAEAQPEAAEAWEALIGHTRSDVIEMEQALAYLIDASYNILAPVADRITEREEAHRDRTARGADRFIRRGFIVHNHAYILSADVGNMAAGIVLRVPAERAATA